MVPVEKPSRTRHAACAYWLMSRDGFRAEAQGQHASRTPSEMAALFPLMTLLWVAQTLVCAAQAEACATNWCGQERSCKQSERGCSNRSLCRLRLLSKHST